MKAKSAALALILSLTAFIHAEDAVKKIAVLPFSNETDKAPYDALAEAATRSLSLGLTSLGDYDVLTPSEPEAQAAKEALGTWAEASKADYVCYGSIVGNTEGKTSVKLFIYDRGKGATRSHDSDYVGSMEIFQACDDLILDSIADIAGARVGFARIEFTNSGEQGNYEVAIDGIRVGRNLAAIPAWRTGFHEILVTQQRMLSTEILFKGRTTLMEGQTFSIDVAIPLITPEEKEKIESTESEIRSLWNDENSADEIKTRLSQYIALFRDTSYCAGMTAYKEKALALSAEWNEVRQQQRARSAAKNAMQNSLDSFALDLYQSFQEQKTQARTDLWQHNKNVRRGGAYFVAGILGAACAGTCYALGSQAYKKYIDSEDKSDSAKTAVQLYNAGVIGGGTVGGLSLILSLGSFSAGPSRTKAMIREQDADKVLTTIEKRAAEVAPPSADKYR